MHTSPALFSRKFIPPFSVLLIGLIALLVKCWDLLLQRSETAPCNVYLPALAEVTSFHSSWRGTSHSHWAPMGSGWTQCCPSTKHPEEWITTPVEIVCIYVLLWVFICYCVYLFTCQSDCHILANMPNHTSGTTSSAFESFRLLFQNFPHWCYSDACTSQYILMYMCICIIYACLWIVYKPTQRLLVQWELLLLQTCAHCLVQEPQDAFHWCLLKSKHSCKNCNNQVAFSLLALFFSSYHWMGVLALLSVQCEMLAWCCCCDAHCMMQGCRAPQSFQLFIDGVVTAPTARHHFCFAEGFPVCSLHVILGGEVQTVGVVTVSMCAERSVCM